MRSKRKAAQESGPTVTFDLKKRHEYLTGFRKRKKERKRKGQRDLLEQERKEKIDLKWEHREEVKRQYKEIQWAERRVEKLLGIGNGDEDTGGKEKGLARLLKKRRAALADEG